MEKAFSLFGKLSLGVIIAGILLGGGIYLGNRNHLETPTPNPIVAQSITPIATPQIIQPNTPVPSITSLTITGASPFSSYSLDIPQSWQTKKDIVADRTVLTIFSSDYNIIISQSGGEGGKCIYPGEPSEDFSSSYNAPTQIVGSIIQFNRATTQGSKESGNQIYYVCELKSGSYQFPTDFGYVTYNTPQNPDSNMLTQMDSIISSIKK